VYKEMNKGRKKKEREREREKERKRERKKERKKERKDTVDAKESTFYFVKNDSLCHCCGP
jgi:hypothetical protein